MKPSILMTVLEKAIRGKKPLLLVGPPGVGKTDMIHQIAEKLAYNLIVMHPATMDPTDLKGMPAYDRETGLAKFVPFGSLQTLVDATEPTVVLVDDFGHANHAVQAAFMHLFLARHIGDHMISNHVTFIIATNDTSHYAGVTGILEPMKSRVLSIIHVDVDLEDWIAWALQHRIAPEVISFMRFLGHQLLSDFQPTAGMTNSPSPRGQVGVSDIIKMSLPPTVEKELIKGVVGESYADQIFNYLQLYRDLPDPTEVLRNPDTVPIPDENMIRYAYCGALGAMARPDIMDAIVTFAKRLPIEFAIKLLAYDCKASDPANHETAAYTNWAVANARHMTAI